MTRAIAALVAIGTLTVGLGASIGGSQLAVLAAVALGVNLAAFVPAWLGRTERFYDLTGALTSLLLTTSALALGRPGPVALLAAAAAVAWSGRLGWMLFRRVNREGGDGRFDAIKESAPRFMVAWTLQGAWVFLTLLSVLTLILANPAPSVFMLPGALVWLGGFALEVVADRQKARFRSEHPGQFIDVGLWSISRHPNYLGEIVMWTGMFAVGIGTWEGLQWLTVLSPLFVTLLLTRISGVPLLEQRADERFGDDPAYQAYKERTPVLFPWIS